MKHAHSHATAVSGSTSGLNAFTATLGGSSLRIIDTLVTWQRRADERRHLREIDDRLLSDMGLTRADAYKESRKPFWRE